MVRAVSVPRSPAILCRMDMAAYEPGMRILREDRRKAPSPETGAPTMGRHEEPRAVGSAGTDTDGQPVGRHAWIRGAMCFNVGLNLHGRNVLASESGRSVREISCTALFSSERIRSRCEEDTVPASERLISDVLANGGLSAIRQKGDRILDLWVALYLCLLITLCDSNKFISLHRLEYRS